MPTSKNLFRVTAAVVAAGVILLGPLPTSAQQDDRKAEEPAAAAPEAPAAPAAVQPPRVPPYTPTAPPRNLKKVGDHWTPYDPPDPESFPPDASVHIIVKGETLWGLADLSYNNPYLWPQLWDQNRYIFDSHWIYPGDPLLVPPRPMVVSEGTPAEVVPQGQEGAPSTSLEPMPEGEGEVQEPLTAEAQPAPEQPAQRDRSGYAGGHEPLMVDQSDIRCSGYIAESGKRSHLFIAENDEPGYDNVTLGTIIYLNRGSKNDERLQPGARFSIIEREGKVQHPISDRSQGWFIKRLGEIKVLKVMEDTAVAVVTFACDEIRVGNELVEIAYQQVPQRTAPPFDRLRFERNGKPTGYVIHVQDTVVRVAAGDLAQIDLGNEDGLNPGDFLTAFELITPGKRPHQTETHYKFNGEVFEGADLHYDYFRDEYPAKPVGQMVVVSTGSHTSTVKVIHAVSEVHRGTMVEVD
jgi:LysM domain